ncbi:hypothetical protein CEP52_016794 [Fusarium oligoseptatum]|uniref:Uncharacterized protein n=1 Tax=Fusarium oligoseptatum TaxID=2604345 RepID=A0A428RZW2_9HYPO|nr:hypothetical protein CEP52_016794 [Fusarium oligoseptatum]
MRIDRSRTPPIALQTHAVGYRHSDTPAQTVHVLTRYGSHKVHQATGMVAHLDPPAFGDDLVGDALVCRIEKHMVSDVFDLIREHINEPQALSSVMVSKAISTVCPDALGGPRAQDTPGRQMPKSHSTMPR